MVQSAATSELSTDPSGSEESEEALRTVACAAYRWMVLARVLDDKFASLYRAGKIYGGVFLGRGQEALSASIGVTLRPSDVFAPLIRDGAGRLAFGESVLDAVRTYLGSPKGPMRSRDGNVHRGDPKRGYIPMISHLGAMVSVVNGVLMARRMRGISDVVGVTCIGDGATSTGAFHESLNQAAVERLPLVLVVADNQYAYSTPTSRQFACAKLEDRAQGYGMDSATVDGTDMLDCLQVMSRVVERARREQRPCLVIARLLRLCGHGEHDDAGYVDPELKSSALGRDCNEVAAAELTSRNWLSTADLASIRGNAVDDVDRAVATAQREAGPDPYREDWCALATRRLAEPLEFRE